MTRFLGNGSYGCVYTPPLKCKNALTSGQKTKGMVGKVFFADAGFDEEVAMIKFVKEYVDPQSEFTIAMTDTCTIQKPHRKKMLVNAPSDCTNLQGNESQLIYPNGGNDLKAFAKRYKNNPNAFFRLFKAMHPVFRGLVIMASKGVVHSDIKPANMLYHHRSKRVVLIDFDLMKKYHTLYTPMDTHIKDADYMYFPPEYKIQVHGGNIDHRALLESYVERFRHLGSAQAFFERFNVSLEDDLANLLSKKKRRTKKDAQRFYEYVDVYSLGIALAEIMRSMQFLEPEGLSKSVRAKLALVKHLIHHMIRPNPYERWHPKQVYATYQELLGML